jgi:hypothetical protein
MYVGSAGGAILVLGLSIVISLVGPAALAGAAVALIATAVTFGIAVWTA